MDGLIAGPTGANRPVFVFEGHADLTASAIPTGQFSLSGPSVKLDAAHWPVRGDLAHVRLAGKVFVPHYAVPMERVVVAGGAPLLAANKADAEVREQLPAAPCSTCSTLPAAGPGARSVTMGLSAICQSRRWKNDEADAVAAPMRGCRC